MCYCFDLSNQLSSGNEATNLGPNKTAVLREISRYLYVEAVQFTIKLSIVSIWNYVICV